MKKEIVKWVLGCVAGIAAVFAIGYIGVGYTRTVGKAQTEAKREVFKESTAYTEQAAMFLADSYKQYNEAGSEEDKKAIMSYVSIKYPNLNTDSIDNAKLRKFYEDCITGGF